MAADTSNDCDYSIPTKLARLPLLHCFGKAPLSIRAYIGNPMVSYLVLAKGLALLWVSNALSAVSTRRLTTMRQ